jgi:hypothetical protein
MKKDDEYKRVDCVHYDHTGYKCGREPKPRDWHSKCGCKDCVSVTLKTKGGEMKSIKVGDFDVLYDEKLSGKRIAEIRPNWDLMDSFIDDFSYSLILPPTMVTDLVNGGKFTDPLIDMGLLVISKNKIKKGDENKVYEVGDKFKVKVPSGEKILTLSKMTNPYMGKGHCLWALINNSSGERWNGTLATEEKDFLTLDEFTNITGTKQSYDKFIKVA